MEVFVSILLVGGIKWAFNDAFGTKKKKKKKK
jgi:hypothetical protein